MAQERISELVPAGRRSLSGWDLESWLDDPFFRPSRSWSPFLSLMSPETGAVAPAVDIYEDKDELILKAELPGIGKDNIEVTFSEGCITVSGEKKLEDIKEKDYYNWERSSGSFCRSFRLPMDVDAEKITSTYKDGVLEVRMPKHEKMKVEIH